MKVMIEAETNKGEPGRIVLTTRTIHSPVKYFNKKKVEYNRSLKTLFDTKNIFGFDCKVIDMDTLHFWAGRHYHLKDIYDDIDKLIKNYIMR